MNAIEKLKVLVLEDDSLDYRVLHRAISDQERQFDVEWSQTMACALEKLGSQEFDVVLSDLNVPDSRGMVTVAQLRQHCGAAAIVVLTGSDDQRMEDKILQAGAQDYLVKGELGGRAVVRTALHAIERKRSSEEMKSLVKQLRQSHDLLEDHAKLLHRKNHRLRRLYKTAQEFVDNVSHDFRTPLTVIKDYVSIIREGMVGEINPEQEEMLDKVCVRADDLNIMVDDLLDVSKLESGLLGAWRRKSDVEAIFERAQGLLQQRASTRKVELVVECEDNLPVVYCDADKVGRVITNLAVNAIKFAKEPGLVRLSAEADPASHQVVISVTDNGPGIDQESLDRIFQRFQQLDDHMQSSAKGFGLGLNIAQQLCRLNLGELSVKSQVGQGSTFSFSIPFADPSEILQRWLKLTALGSDLLRVVEIEVNEDTSDSTADEFDNFLNCLLRRKDLLLRTDSSRWLLVMAVVPSEADLWFARATKEHKKASRNRPLGPLPEYSAEVLHEWSADVAHETVIREFGANIGKPVQQNEQVPIY